MNKNFFIKKLDEIITDFNLIRSKATYEDLSGNVEEEEIMAVITKSKAAVARIVGCNSEYYKDIYGIMQRVITEGSKLKLLIGIIIALKSDLQNDYLKSLSDIIKSDVFSDYLEMSEYLLKEGYKDPAAVIIGSTLESHLRKLCADNDITLESTNTKGELIIKHAERLNVELAKASVYSSAYQKQVTAWLGLRNLAAHGKYADYKLEEIVLMHQGIRQFILTTK